MLFGTLVRLEVKFDFKGFFVCNKVRRNSNLILRKWVRFVSFNDTKKNSTGSSVDLFFFFVRKIM